MATDRRDDVTAGPFNLRADAYAGTADAYVRFRVPYPTDLLANPAMTSLPPVCT